MISAVPPRSAALAACLSLACGHGPTSAPLVPANGPVFGSGDMSGMNAVTLPSFALPMRMPRFQSPCFRELFDSESATYSTSSLVMKRPLGRLNCFHSAMKLPS